MAEQIMTNSLVVNFRGGKVYVQGLYHKEGGVKLGPEMEAVGGVVGGEGFPLWFREQHRGLGTLLEEGEVVPDEAPKGAKARTMKPAPGPKP